MGHVTLSVAAAAVALVLPACGGTSFEEAGGCRQPGESATEYNARVVSGCAEVTRTPAEFDGCLRVSRVEEARFC